jgi:hypothetical protein
VGREALGKNRRGGEGRRPSGGEQGRPPLGPDLIWLGFLAARCFYTPITVDYGMHSYKVQGLFCKIG